MLHEQQQTISMRSNVPEWTHVLLVNTPCSHLHNLCVGSGLASRVTLAWVSRGRLSVSIYTEVDLLLISFFYCSMWLLLGFILNGTPFSDTLWKESANQEVCLRLVQTVPRQRLYLQGKKHRASSGFRGDCAANSGNVTMQSEKVNQQSK
jgi:hypothetical protein